MAAVDDLDAPAPSLLVGLRSPEADDESGRVLDDVVDEQRREFAAPEPAGEPDQHKDPVAVIDRPLPIAATAARTSSTLTPRFWVGATPRRRRRPFMVSRTVVAVVGLGCPARRCASPIAARRRFKVETRLDGWVPSGSARSTR